MFNRRKRIETANSTELLSDAALDAVVGGRMKLITAVPPATQSGSGAGLPIGEWSGFPHYLGPF
jgi:hypothetical protein